VQVAKQLYIGSYLSTFDAGYLKTLGISAILNLAGEKCPARHSTLEYACIRMADSPHTDISHSLAQALDFIERMLAEGKSVLVHCVKGLSRSPTVACAYIMWKQSLNFTDSLAVIKANYPEADPNLGFVSQLQRFGQASETSYDPFDACLVSSELGGRTPGALMGKSQECL
jgi:dual specificity MAP kinase phosphatase